MALRVAVVTGANKGIGLEIAKKMAAAGFRTVMAARSEELGRRAVQEVGGADAGVEFRQLDLNSASSISSFV